MSEPDIDTGYTAEDIPGHGPDTITFKHNGQSHSLTRHQNKWVADARWYDLVLQFPSKTATWPIVRKGSLRESPKGIGGIEALQKFCAIRHKAISTLVKHRTGEWPRPQKSMSIEET